MNWNNPPSNIDTQIDSIGIAELGYVAGEQLTKFRVGDYAQGGIIFWLDETGQHGLVCSRSDQSAGVRWYGGTYGVNHATPALIWWHLIEQIPFAIKHAYPGWSINLMSSKRIEIDT